MSEPLRYGVVGCASMGHTHADALASVDGAELVAGADRDGEVSDSFGEAYDCAAYTDAGEMAETEGLDAASVCTPNGTHADVVSELAARGVHVLCEKPLEVTPERVEAVIDVCQEAGVQLGGVYQRRTRPEMRLAREAVRSGAVGELVLLDVAVKWHRGDDYYRGWHGSAELDGGVLHTQALHGIDLLGWVGGDVARAAGTLSTRNHAIEVPDTASATVEFECGASGTVSATTAMEPQYPISLSVHGTEGSLRISEGEVEAYEDNQGSVAYDLPEFEHGAGHAGQIRDFVAAIREGREPMVPPEEARRALDTVFAIQESDRTGAWVSVGSD